MRFLTSTAILGLLAGTAMAAPPQIVTDFPVTGSLVQKVLGDLGEAQVLIGEGADPHHFQLRPSDAKALESADLLVWIGPELTPWMERATENLGKGASMPLLAVPGTHLQAYGEKHDHGHAEEDHGHAESADDNKHRHDHAEEEHAHEHAEAEHDHDHAEEGHAPEDHDHGEEGHDHGHSHDGTDPHAWLDPYNAQIWLTAIAEDLATRDPENAATYTANAEAAIAQVKSLDTQITTLLEPVKEHPFVVFHDAYGYFTTHYGLQPAIAVSLGDASTPSAARLKDISAQTTDSGAVCAFPEFGHDASLVQNAIEGSKVRLGEELDPAGRGLEGGAGLYDELLLTMGNALAGCLSADG